MAVKVMWLVKTRLPVPTCILLLPQSATMMFPFTSTATPVGALNWPLPSPFDPNFSRNSPSVLNTYIMGCNRVRHRDRQTDKHPPDSFMFYEILKVWLWLLLVLFVFISILCFCSCGLLALTLTEWLWKSVTMISLLWLTAAKWGPWKTARPQPWVVCQRKRIHTNSCWSITGHKSAWNEERVR